MKKLFFLLLLFATISCYILPACNYKINKVNTGKNSYADTISFSLGRIVIKDKALLQLIDTTQSLEVLGKGFGWAEGPVWIKDGGYLLFSDVNANTIYKYKEGEGITTYLQHAGFTGPDSIKSSGSNGLVLDNEGRLIICQQGNRMVARMEAPLNNPAVKFSNIASSYNGKRLSSPNDIICDSKGNFYFTDPPYGLKQGDNAPDKELTANGVYRINKSGIVDLLIDTLTRPNGIALSTDEKILYIGNSDGQRAILVAYKLKEEKISSSKIVFDATGWITKEQPGAFDGLKVHTSGWIFATGPGGVWIFNSQQKHLGIIETGVQTANCAFDVSETYLYITANQFLMRLKMKKII
jgi:gluconolactonase